MPQKSAPILVFVVCVAISHLALPLANSNRDFLFFTPWNMFSEPAREYIYDISFGGGRSFLFRDHRDEIKKSSINQVTLYSLLWSEDVSRIQRDFGGKIKELCQCEKIELVQIKSSIHDHIVKKAAPEIVKRWNL